MSKETERITREFNRKLKESKNVPSDEEKEKLIPSFLNEEEIEYVKYDSLSSLLIYKINENNKKQLKILKEMGYVKLREVQKISQIAEIYNISRKVIEYRLKFLEEGIDYIKLGDRQPTLITPRGVEKILNLEDEKLW